MAGYSGTPLPKKLGMKPGFRVLLWNAPKGFPMLLGDFAKEIVLSRDSGDSDVFDVIMLFSESRSALAKYFPTLCRLLSPAGGLWAAWPKRVSGVATDLTETVV